MVHKKIGDKVNQGDVLATFYGDDENKVKNAMKDAKNIFTLTDEPVNPPKLIKKTII